jgi:hypothetical protein
MTPTRRAFLRGILGAAAVAASGVDFVAAAVGKPTAFATRIRASMPLSEAVIAALAAHREQLIENVTQNNALLDMLKAKSARALANVGPEHQAIPEPINRDPMPYWKNNV